MSATSIVSLFPLIRIKVRMNLKSEASRSYLSYVWWILEPALMVAVFYAVFGVLLAQKREGFVLFLIVGKIPYLWFARSVSNSAESIMHGRGLMQQLPISKLFFPLVVICQDSVKSLAVFLLMFTLAFFMGGEPTVAWLTLPLLMIVQLLFIMVVAISCAMLVPFLPDMRFIISTFLMMMMFASGIFYTYTDVLLPSHQQIFLLNPLASLITSYRAVLIDGAFPDFIRLAGISVSCLCCLFIITVVMRKIDHIYPRLVVE